MPQGRILLKSISQSKKLALLRTDTARLLYSWLIPHLDVNGNFYGDAVTVNALVFTRLAKSADDVEDALQDLVNNGLLLRYHKDGETFLNVPDFQEKQPSLNPKKEGKPSIPLFGPDRLPTYSGPTPEEVRTSKVKESKVKESKANDVEPQTGPKIQSSDVLCLFNIITGQKRNLTNETAKLIIKLIKKGYTLDQFESVIRLKTAEFGAKDEMRKYVRPATFFAEARFEDYLEQVQMSKTRRLQVGESPKRKWTPEERASWKKSFERELRSVQKDETIVKEKMDEWEKRNPV